MDDELFNITHDNYEPYDGNLYYNQELKKDQIFLKSFLFFMVLVILFILINRCN